jgi:hypothetical protein
MAEDEDLEVLRVIVLSMTGEQPGQGSDHERDQAQHRRMVQG